MQNQRPIHSLIRFTQTDADNAREWAGIQAKPQAPNAPKRPAFGKKGAK